MAMNSFRARHKPTVPRMSPIDALKEIFRRAFMAKLTGFSEKRSKHKSPERLTRRKRHRGRVYGSAGRSGTKLARRAARAMRGGHMWG